MNPTARKSETQSVLKLSPTEAWKQRSREQWTADPCGAHVASEHDFGSREYFDAIERYRYSEYAPWMREWTHNWMRGWTREGVESDGPRVLEVGFGTGTDLLQFARAGAVVTGIDLTPRSVEIARQRFAVYGYEAELLVGDGESLPFPQNAFDIVYSFGVLHHTPDTRGGVRELYRVLRPGGRALVMLYNRGSLYYWIGLMLKRGVLRGELIRHTPREIMSRYVEFSEHAANPLVKAYTRREVKRLFSDFRDVRIEVNQLTRAELKSVGRVLPEPIFQWLARAFGWNLIITATK
ncbi:MAG TPA: methyltransferase domain-containing protein [Blastocatellia bacterium]|nr:methyltransferase domain-containing protein [Blastocatellia bacterium]